MCVGVCIGRRVVGWSAERRGEDWRDEREVHLRELSKGRNKQMKRVQGEGFKDP